LEKFTEYIKVKIEVNKALGNRYNHNIFRKFRWYGYVNRERYYTGVIKKIKEMMTNEGASVLIYGDYEGKHNLRGTRPTPGIGLKFAFGEVLKT